MAQRFIRCQLCGLPHPAEVRECPVHHRPIVAGTRLAAEVPAPEAPRPQTDLEGLSPEDTTPMPLVRPRSPRPQAAPASEPSPRPTVDAPLVGSLLGGRYRVHNVLAFGGMGVVYEAVHVGLGRRVAVKALHRKYAVDQLACARFQQEAMVAGRVGHPNIVEVYDIGTLDDGAPYLVMERLEGETLSALLRRTRPLSLRESVELAAQVTSALVATHSKGVIHRDLKPDNLFLVRREGLPSMVKVLDFGVSKTLAEGAPLRLTRAGFVMGTPAYMAPEQARGERDLDGRVDLYATGMILYECLTGRLPFAARAVPALLAELQRSTPPRPRLLRVEVPHSLDAFVMKALARDRAERFPDATAMLRALQALGPFEDALDAPGDDPTEVSGPPTEAPKHDTPSQRVEIFARVK